MTKKGGVIEQASHRTRDETAALTFGELLQQLRRRAGMTQSDLALAVNYSVSYISNLEKNQRLPTVTTILERFVSALGLLEEPQTALRLLELAAAVRGERLPPSIHQHFGDHRQAGGEERTATHTLPQPLLPILGREQDIQTICNRLLTHSGRLLTLIGPPGIGKTTLALGVAARLQPSFPDGIYFVPLVAVTEPAIAEQILMSSLGLTESSHANKAPKTRLIEHLRRRKVLLLLDNLEQLLALVPLLRDLLQACPHLRLLITSRAALRLRVEQRFRVTPLSVTDAVALFVQHAQAVELTFALTPNNALVVEELCQRLDCLPLAIELVAARIDLFSPAALLARIQDYQLDLLHNEAQDLEPHHRTLRNAIHRSYSLLTPTEQTLFRQLGVFCNGFDLASVEALIADQSLETLTSLVNKSMVQVEVTFQGERRFNLLETLRAYALEQLTAADELNAARYHHAHYFCMLAETAMPALRGPDEIFWLDRLTLEHENLRAAIAWSLSNDQAVTIGLRLIGALYLFWYRRSYLKEGQAWLQRALAQATNTTPALRAKLLQGATLFAWVHDIPDSHRLGRLWIAESTALYRQVGEKGELAMSLCYHGFFSQSYAEFLPAATEAKALFTEIGDEWGRAWASAQEYLVCQPYGQHLPLQESVAQLRVIGAKSGLNNALLCLARQSYAKGDLTLARSSIQEAIVLFQEVGHKSVTASCYCFLGDLLRTQNELLEVPALYTESIRLAQQSGDTWWVALTGYSQGLLTYKQGDLTQATCYFQESLAYFAQYLPSIAGPVAANLRGLALVAGAQKAFQRAVRLLTAAGEHTSVQDFPDWPHEDDLFSHCLAQANTQLSKADYQMAWTQGRNMSIEEAVIYAQSQP